MKKQSGFTLIELMVVLVIVGVLFSVAGPSLTDSMTEKQLIATTNDLLSSLHIARSEAIKLNKRVTICASSNGTDCSNSNEWENGWIVFVDAAGAVGGAAAVCADATSDCLLRVQDAIDQSSLKIRGLNQDSAGVASFTFTSRGLPKDANGTGQSGVFSVCVKDSGNVVYTRAVALSFSGRVRISDSDTVISSNTNSTTVGC